MVKREIAPMYPKALLDFVIALKESKQISLAQAANELDVGNLDSFLSTLNAYRNGRPASAIADRLYEDFPFIIDEIRKGTQTMEIAKRTQRNLSGFSKMLNRYGLGPKERARIISGESEPPPVSIIWTGRRSQR